MSIWIVRAGRDGTEEATDLEHHVAVIGWDELPDLAAVQSREELQDLIQETYPGATAGARRSDATQVWAFRSEIAEGDFIILPLKSDSGALAIGRVTGPYRYRPDLPRDAHHTRPVDWLQMRLARSDLASDLLASINVPRTVSRISLPNAEERILPILEGEPDPGPSAEPKPHDRESEDYARSVFARLYPDERARHEVLCILAASIQHAHGQGPRCWELTLRPNSFMLNVGMVWMLSGEGGDLRLDVDGRSLDEEEQEMISAVGELGPDRGIRVLKMSYAARFSGNILTRLREEPFFPALQAAHFRAIEEAKSHRSVAMWRRAHSPGLLKYLRSDTGEDLPDPEYTVDPASAPVRNIWLFQANPRKYDLAARLMEAKVGDEDDWYVSRYANQMRAGDIALFWQSGANAGLYAIGELTGGIFMRPVSEWREDEAAGEDVEPAVPFRFTQILESPIPRSTFQGIPGLASMLIIRSPTGTNFRVTPEEWRTIQSLLDPMPASSMTRYAEPAFDAITDAIQSQGLRIDENTLRRYHLSLKVRGFVILAGISGTGKTWLAGAYARAVGAQHLVVAVAPNWTTNEDLLGYWSPLDSHYHDTEFSKFLRDASAEYAHALVESRLPRPFHVVLDEMNLARVEYYFAQFLSAIEERARDGIGRIVLTHDDVVLLPPNLYFTGTVNVDETTQSFADKVYDRAQIVELTASYEALWLQIGDKPYRDLLMQIWRAVHEVAPFAFRVIEEIRTYVEDAQSLGGTWKDAFDEQILQKVLPKLTKTDIRVGEVLRECIDIAEKNSLSLTLEKASAMEAGFQRYGFASYF